MRRLLRAAAFGLILACGSVHAVLWGFVDGHGVAHLSSQALDGRYRLVLGETARGAGRVAGKTDAAPPILTWLQIAPAAKAVQHLLREAAQLHGIDLELLQAVIAVESGFEAKAVSPRGAIGLMQLTPATAQRYATAEEARHAPELRLLDARTNVHIGARMLADLMRRYGRVDIALAAWNAGEGPVRRHGRAMPPYRETQAHVQRVLELYWSLLQHSQNQRATRMRLHEPRSNEP